MITTSVGSSNEQMKVGVFLSPVQLAVDVGRRWLVTSLDLTLNYTKIEPEPIFIPRVNRGSGFPESFRNAGRIQTARRNDCSRLDRAIVDNEGSSDAGSRTIRSLIDCVSEFHRGTPDAPHGNVCYCFETIRPQVCHPPPFLCPRLMITIN